MKNILSIAFAVAIFAGAVFAQDITGSWKDGSVGSVGYQNQVTGSVRSGRSHIFTYKFLPNGSYEFVGYMELNNYGCSSTLFNQITGKYSVDGSTISLNPNRDFWRSGNSCAASGNKESSKTPTKKTLEFELKQEESGRELLCIQDGEANTCYGREK